MSDKNPGHYESWYSDYKWIRVKHWKRSPDQLSPDNIDSLEKHHIEETTFLISEIRRLARLLDESDEKMAEYEKTSGA